MLRQRVLTALLLVPLLVGGILWLPTSLLAVLLAIVVLLGCNEWARLSGVVDAIARAIFVVISGLLLLAGWLARGQLPLAVFYQLLALFWVLATMFLILRRAPVDPVVGVRWWQLPLGSVLLLAAWLSLLQLHAHGEQGPALLLFMMVLIWVADSAAYFAGRAFGKHKLSPQVSPGKTWEGVAGALLGALVCGWALVQLALYPGLVLAEAMLLCLLVTLVSIGGDLFESLLKRERGQKDSGNLLPGHGGVLDRIDSLIAAAPVFLVGLYWLGGQP